MSPWKCDLRPDVVSLLRKLVDRWNKIRNRLPLELTSRRSKAFARICLDTGATFVYLG
jgi:hypothetical protein